MSKAKTIQELQHATSHLLPVSRPTLLQSQCLLYFICICSVCLRVYLPVWFLLISGKDCPSISLCLPLARTRVFTVVPSVQASYIMLLKTPYIRHEFIESVHGSLRVIISTQVKVIQVFSLILKAKVCASELLSQQQNCR